MAQSQSDLFSFLITPEFDTQGVDDSYKLLETKLKKVAEKISNQISQAMGSGFQFPAGFEKDNLGQVIKLVESLGGSIKRAGTNITSSFKDANGTIVTLKQNIKDAVDIAESLELSKVGTDLQKAEEITKKYAQLRASGDSYTGAGQTKEQNQLEQQIIKSLEEQYSLEKKIADAKASGNTANEQYYTGLKNLAEQEELSLEKQYKGSLDLSIQTLDRLDNEKKLYEQKLATQAAEEKAAQTEKDALNSTIDLVKEYYSIRSNLEAESFKNGTGTEYYATLSTQLGEVENKMKSYGILVDQTKNIAGIVFDQTASGAVKTADNIQKINDAVKQVNNSFNVQASKQQDALDTQKQKEYVEQQKQYAKEQEQLEQNIIKNLEEQFNYQKKIIDAKNSGDKANEEYYNGLLDIAKGEEQVYTIQYTGSKNNINQKKQEIVQEQQLYQKKSDSVKQENDMVEAIKKYAKEYQNVKNLESKGQQNTQAYTDSKNALQQLTNTLTTYGVQVVTSSDGTTKLVAQQNSMADSSNKVKAALDNANGSLVKTDTAQNSLSQSIQSSVENFIKYRVAMEAINKITSEFTSAIYDMNEAMTQVRMVTMGSYEDTVALADSYTKLAKQLGTTTTTVAEGADSWLKCLGQVKSL